MPTFDAQSAVEALDWKFLPYANAEGTIPEPSDAQIGKFLDGLRKLTVESQQAGLEAMQELGENPTPQQQLDALNKLDPGEFVATLDKLTQLYAQLCANKPSAAQMRKLPLRARVKFFAWVMEEVVRPEAGTAGGTAEVLPLRSAAGG